MSRPTPRRLPVRPGPIGVGDVTAAMRRLLDGDARPVALAPAVEAGPGAGHHAAAMSAALREDAPIEREDAALVLATSGSTGEPHGVLISLPALLASADGGAGALGPPGLWLAAVPVTGIGGVLTVVRSLRAGFEPVALPAIGGAATFTAAGFAAAARETLARADAFGVPAYVSLVPTQLRRLVAEAGEGLETLASFAAVLVGGAAVPLQDREAASARGARILESYGATETSGGVVYDGQPLPGTRLAFLDPVAGGTSADGPGRIIIDGPTLALGYRLRPDLTAAHFHADGFHAPDFGHREPGRLLVTSRLDQIVKVGGVKVSLTAISHTLCGHPRVIDAVTVAETDPEWGAIPAAYVVTDQTASSPEAFRDELVALVADRLGRASCPRRVEIVRELPTSHTGKTARPGSS